MTEAIEQIPGKRARKRRHGALTGLGRISYVITAVTLAILCAALAFTQLGFAGLGPSGEYVAYIIVLLFPVALAALLLGTLGGLAIGLFAGAALLLHSAAMPLDYYELTFVTPLTSVVMLGVVGLMLGLLFAFALRNNPPPVKAAIYIVIVCIIVSWLYSVGFIINSLLFNTVDIALHTYDSLTDEQISYIAADRTMSLLLRMGDVGLQAWLDAALMAVTCIIAYITTIKAKAMSGDMSLRSIFAVRLSLVVFMAFLVTAPAAFVSVTVGEVSTATANMESEISYLWNQLNHDDWRSVLTLDQIAAKDQSDDSEETPPALTVLDGYTTEADGTIVILLADSNGDTEKHPTFANDYTIALSDDPRFPAGASLFSAVDEEVVQAILKSAETGKIMRAVYDEQRMETNGDAADDEITYIRSEIVYLLAREQDGCTVTIMQPASMVHSNRINVMSWTSLSAFVLLVVVFVMVFMLLDRMVLRRIDETNAVLARITAGDLDARAEAGGTREFSSLSSDLNKTVETLKGWIAEAESRMDAELATAKAIQASALPSIFPPYPDIPKFDIYATMEPAREVGGDFYDLFLIGDCTAEEGKLGFVMADVSGKGVPAALFMMKAMTQLRDYLQAGTEVGEAVENANRQLCEGNDAGMFVTVWAGVLDYATGHVDYVNAGHNPPLLWQKGKGWIWLKEKSGLPLGLFSGLPYDAHSLDCSLGDQLLLYTDGVTESMNVDGKLYDEDRLLELARENQTAHPRSLVESVRQSIASWAEGAEQSDDITVMALEVGVPPEITATLTLPADVKSLNEVNDFIHDELDKRLCPLRVQNQLDIAVEELFVNVCRYAYPDATPEEPGTVRILRTYSAEPPSIKVAIADDGIPFDPLSKPDAVTPDNIADVPIGGLGILMAKKCVDEIRYRREGDSNIVSIMKKW